MVFKKFKEDIVEPFAKSKIVITFYWTLDIKLDLGAGIAQSQPDEYAALS